MALCANSRKPREILGAQSIRGRRRIGIGALYLIGIPLLVLIAPGYIYKYDNLFILMLPLVIFGALVLISWFYPSARVGLGLAASALSVIASIVGVWIIYSGYEGAGWRFDVYDSISLAMAGVVLGVVAAIIFRPPRPQLPLVIAGLFGMLALFAFAFFVGVMQRFNLSAGMLYAFALVAIGAFTLGYHLRRSRRPGNGDLLP